MGQSNELIFALNGGAVSPVALERVDLQKMRLAGEHPINNMLPQALGPLSLRPGSEMLAQIDGNVATRPIRMTRQVGSSYILLFSANEMRVMSDGAIVQVPAVDTVMSTGAWTDQSTTGASASGGTTLTLTATSTATARLRQAVGVSPPDNDIEHVLSITVTAGPVTLRVGLTAGGQELRTDVELKTGSHQVAFTPPAGTITIYVELSSTSVSPRTVTTCQLASALLGGSGDLVVPTPWTFAQVEALRTWQSIDVLFCGDGAQQQRQIEHRGLRSWGIALFDGRKGPWIPGSQLTTMQTDSLSGTAGITAGDPVFENGHIGSMLELTSVGNTSVLAVTAADQAGDYITISGVDSGRIFYRTGVDSTFVGTVVLERSFDPGEPLLWSSYLTYTDGAVGFARAAVDDGLDNLTAHYRFRCTAYTSGSCTMTLEYESDSRTGRGRITGLGSATGASVDVYENFGNLLQTRTWRLGAWSDVEGWPRVPVIHDSRMHWFRGDTDYGSYVDDYNNFDDLEDGDSAPFTRTVGTQGQDGVVWAASLSRLVIGTPAFEGVITASELDEPLTATRYTVRRPSRRGCADIEPALHSSGLFFVQRSRRRLYNLLQDDTALRFSSIEMSRLNPGAFEAGIKQIDTQLQPETRCYVVMDDGSCNILTYNREEEMAAITTIPDLGGANIEYVCVLPEADQDDVYFITNRSGARYIERLGKEAAQTSVDTATLLDSHKVLTGSVSQITGGTHLANETVQVWADGVRHADVTLSAAGAANLAGTYSRVVYGKRYYGTFKSAKLAYAAGRGTAIGQEKIVRTASVILNDSCVDGLSIGMDASNLDPMPDYVDGAARTANQFFAQYDQPAFPIPSDWNVDSRIYIRADSAEGPLTLSAIVLDVETRDGHDAQDQNGNG